MFTDINGTQLQSGDYVKVPAGSDRPFSVGKVAGTNKPSVQWADASGGCGCSLFGNSGRAEDIATLERATEAEYNVAKAMWDKLNADHSKQIDAVYDETYKEIRAEVKYQQARADRLVKNAKDQVRREMLNGVATLFGVDSTVVARVFDNIETAKTQIEIESTVVAAPVADADPYIDDDEDEDDELFDDGEFEDDDEADEYLQQRSAAIF